MEKQNAFVQIPHNPCSSNNLLPQTSKTQPPKIDATDRRQIEAQNEDKSHTTKATLDDIKRVHQKEKTKKEKNNINPHQIGMDSSGPEKMPDWKRWMGNGRLMEVGRQSKKYCIP